MVVCCAAHSTCDGFNFSPFWGWPFARRLLHLHLPLRCEIHLIAFSGQTLLGSPLLRADGSAQQTRDDGRLRVAVFDLKSLRRACLYDDRDGCSSIISSRAARSIANQ
jgi:hypothetical protein